MEHKSSLRRSGWYAGAVLLVFCLLAHFTSAQPEGGVGGAAGTLLFTLVQIVVWAIGLTIGIAICIATMLGLYVTCAYLLGGEELGRETGVKVKRAVADKLRQCAVSVNQTLEPEAAGRVATQRSTGKDAVDQLALSDALSANAGQTAALMREVERMSEAVRTATERSREALAAELTPLQERLDQLAGRCDAQESAVKFVDGMAARLDALERQVTAFAALPQQLKALQDELRPVQEGLKQTQEAMKTKAAVTEQQHKTKQPRSKKG